MQDATVNQQSLMGWAIANPRYRRGTTGQGDGPFSASSRHAALQIALGNSHFAATPETMYREVVLFGEQLRRDDCKPHFLQPSITRDLLKLDTEAAAGNHGFTYE